MEKERVKVLEEGISLEEIPTLTNVEKMLKLIEKSSMEEDTKQKLVEKVEKIREDSVRHSKIFNRLLNEEIFDEG